MLCIASQYWFATVFTVVALLPVVLVFLGIHFSLLYFYSRGSADELYVQYNRRRSDGIVQCVYSRVPVEFALGSKPGSCVSLEVEVTRLFVYSDAISVINCYTCD